MTVKGSAPEYGNGCEIAPDGGWGFVVAFAVAVTYSCVIAPAVVFGIVFGPFLAGVGDETSGISIVFGIFNTCFCFTGLAANHLLKTKSCRQVGLLGAFAYFIGSFTSIFVTSNVQLVLSWGVIQGLGIGLMYPAVFTSFNSYFDKRKTVTMSIAQTFIAIVHILFPTLIKMSLSHFGFRGTVALLSAYGLNCVPAMLCLHPVQWHLKKKTTPLLEVTLDKQAEDNSVKNEFNSLLNNKINTCDKNDEASISFSKDDSSSVSPWQFLVDTFDLMLLKDWSFLNLTVGLALAVSSDLSFLSLFPLLLTHIGFDTDEVSFVITTFFVSDLAGRIFLSVLAAIADINNRHLILLSVMYSVVFRIAFFINNSFKWITTVTVALGFLRSLLHVPMTIVISEAQPTKFSSAFSLFMVICGVVSLGYGPTMGLIKQVTGSLDMVVHFLTLGYLFCAIPWVIELVYLKYIRFILSGD